MMTRRDFIRRLTALGLSSAAIAALLEVAGCTPQTARAPAGMPTDAPVALSSPTGSPPVTATDPASPAAPALTTPPPAAPAPPTGGPLPTPPRVAYLAVARGDDPAELTRRAVKALGGMERFVKTGQTVLVKPNICVAYHGPEYAATTNPQVVAALVALCRAAGAASVLVMDYPFGGTAEQAYRVSEIGDAVAAAGGQMVVMGRVKFREAGIPEGVDIKKWVVFQDALKADVLIDVPIAKHHNLAGLTLAHKNLMGLVEDRSRLHSNLGQRLPDLVTLFKPRLTVVDAYRMLMRNGPTGGSLDDVQLARTVIASHDIVAADAYATTLFGQAPDALAYVKNSASRGLGTTDLKAIKIEEIAV